MPINISLSLITTAALFVADSINTKIEARKAARNYLRAQEVHMAIHASNDAQITYLVDLLNRNDVEISEFDLIALNELSVIPNK